jgi:hypothetical protein
MKNFSLLVISFLASVFSFAQEFTPPDSSAILKNQVKSVKIYYTGTGSTHLITQEYHYDKEGRSIYSRVGTSSYYYTFTYTPNGQIASSIQRNADGSVIRGYLNDYTEQGKLYHTGTITERDSVHPELIKTFDENGNEIEESFYMHGTLTRSFKYDYDGDNKIIHYIDSTPGKSAYEYKEGRTVRQTYYNEKNEITESWKIIYSDKERVGMTIRTSGNKTKAFKVEYDIDNQPIVTVNGKKISKEEFVDWDSKFNYLLSHYAGEEYGLPYSDPLANAKYNHELKLDKKGNIIKDTVTGAFTYMNFKPVEFDYEYEYW